ncbi:hypothetical protein ACGRHY_09640 [Streptomyces sp. HK10]|uniref:hypothetical protein n=1 Tax=Streptomyces sp. HK10 TaxID=3373255 RepID=UPI00374850B8
MSSSAVWWTKAALMPSSRYADGSSTMDSSAPQAARETIGGRVTVESGAVGTVGSGDGLAVGLPEVPGSVGSGSVVSGAVDSVPEGSASADDAEAPSAGSLAVAEGAGSSAT